MFCLFLSYFSYLLPISHPIFWNLEFLYSVAGRSHRKTFPIFWVFPDLLGMVRGFSRFVLFLFLGLLRFGVQETVLLVNHALARGTPAIFVFSSFRGVRAAKPLLYWLECRFVIFAIFIQKPPFSGGTKARFTKGTVFGTPKDRAPTRNSPERVRDTIWTFPEKSGKHPGLETPRFSFSQFIRESPSTITTMNCTSRWTSG